MVAGDTRGALAVADTAIARAARVGHRRAEMVGHHAAFFCRHALMDFEGVFRHAEAALTLAQQLGARRFETEALVFLAELHRLGGRRAEALANAEEAVKISRETSIAFLGPFALGALASANDDPTARRAALKEGEELLRAGAVSRNHYCSRATRSRYTSKPAIGRAWSSQLQGWRNIRGANRCLSLIFISRVAERWRRSAAVSGTLRSSSVFGMRGSGSAFGSRYLVSRPRSTSYAGSSIRDPWRGASS